VNRRYQRQASVHEYGSEQPDSVAACMVEFRTMRDINAVLVACVVILAGTCLWLATTRRETERFTQIGSSSSAAMYIMFDQKTRQACWSGPQLQTTRVSSGGQRLQGVGGDAVIPFCKDL
jgi:hypothetical protein